MERTLRTRTVVPGILLAVLMIAVTMMGQVHAKQTTELVCHIDVSGEIKPLMLPSKADVVK